MQMKKADIGVALYLLCAIVMLIVPITQKVFCIQLHCDYEVYIIRIHIILN